jgi:hypothetical protein
LESDLVIQATGIVIIPLDTDTAITRTDTTDLIDTMVMAHRITDTTMGTTMVIVFTVTTAIIATIVTKLK